MIDWIANNWISLWPLLLLPIIGVAILAWRAINRMPSPGLEEDEHGQGGGI